MAWNEPGGNNQDPWGGGNRGNNDGPPDFDEVIKKLQDKVNGLFGGGGGGKSSKSNNKFSLPIGLLLFLAAIAYGFMGIYLINEQERGVVLRLGVYNQTLGPGLNWAPPLIDAVTKVNVTKLRLHSTDGHMLTEDENIIEVELSVQYNIASAKDYVLRVKDPDNSLREATDSALRHVVGSSEMDEVLTTGREQVAIEVQQRLQDYLDSYQTGIQVTKVNVESTQPPRAVQASFDDVIKAREDEERVKNQAEAYANGVLPEARGRAQRMLEDANGYKAEVVSKAKGEAQRFKDLLTEYKKAPKVTRQRLYLDAVQDVMASSSKVLIDVEGGNNLLYLPLDKMMQPGASISPSDVSPATMQEIKNWVRDQVRRESNSTRRSDRGIR